MAVINVVINLQSKEILRIVRNVLTKMENKELFINYRISTHIGFLRLEYMLIKVLYVIECFESNTVIFNYE